MKETKKKRDWLGIIGIILILLAMVFFYFETKACKDPFKNILDEQLKEEGIIYNYAEVSIYFHMDDGIPLKTIPIYIGQQPKINLYNSSK